MAATAITPTEEAEKVLRRLDSFRHMGFAEPDAERLARSNALHHDIVVLLKRGCPMHLVTEILT